MPRTLHSELAQAAEREGVSLNRLIVTRLSRSLAPGTDAHDDAGGTTSRPRHSRLLGYALGVNFVVLLVTGVAAIVLLVRAYG
jgi:hypothetical protein